MLSASRWHQHGSMLSAGSSEMGREIVDGDHHVAKLDERQNTINVTKDIDLLDIP